MAQARIALRVDDLYQLYINGELILADDNWVDAEVVEVDLNEGDVIALRAVDTWGPGGAFLDIALADGTRLASSSEWKVSNTGPSGWNDQGFDDSLWTNAVTYGAINTNPWNNPNDGLPQDSAGQWIWDATNTQFMGPDNDVVFFRFTVPSFGPPNAPPVLANPIADQGATQGAAFSFTAPANAFTDADNDALAYTATRADGSALPGWLSFNAATRTFSGTPGANDVQNVNVRITADDGRGGVASDTFQIAVANVNDAPVVASPIADQAAAVGQAFTFTVPLPAFSDPDGDALSYSATRADGSALPGWLSFNPATRTFSGTPDAETSINVRVTAQDPSGASVSDVFAIAVSDEPLAQDAVITARVDDLYQLYVNGELVLSGTNWAAAQSTTVELKAGDVIALRAVDTWGPGGAFLDIALADGTRLASSSEWKVSNTGPSGWNDQGFDDSLWTNAVTYGAINTNPWNNPNDGLPQDSAGQWIWDATNTQFMGPDNDVVFFRFTVPSFGPPNAPPVLANPIADQGATQGAAFSFTAPANAFTDADNDALAYTATRADGSALPGWLSFNAATRTFSGTPGANDVQNVNVRITADDGRGGVASDTFQIAVANVNDAPVVASPIADQGAAVGQAFTFTVPLPAFSDPDGDALSYSATRADGSALPGWLSFNPATRTFSGTPDAETSINVRVTAQDPSGASVSDVFAIAVSDEPLAQDAVITARVDDLYQLYVNGELVLSGTNWAAAQSTTVELKAGDVIALRAVDTWGPGGAFLDIALADGTRLASSSEWKVSNTGPSGWNDQGFDDSLWTNAVTYGAINTNPWNNPNDGLPQDSAGQWIWDATNTQFMGPDNDVVFFRFTVPSFGPPNAPPVLANPIADQGATQGAAFSFTAPANAFTDADNDALAYTATRADGSALPGWLSFNAATRTFSGTPGANDVQNVNVRITADDGRGGVASDTFQIAVANVNDAPVVASPIADQAAAVGQAFTFTVPLPAFSDPDGDALSYSATRADGSALPGWLSFNPATRTFSGTPDAETSINVRVTAQDPSGASVSDVFAIAVSDEPLAQDAVITARVDDLYQLYVNGELVLSGTNWAAAQSTTVELKAGDVIALRAVDTWGPGGAFLDIALADGTRLASSSEWKVSNTGPSGWNDQGFDDSLWTNAVTYGAINTNPWNNPNDGLPQDSAGQWIWDATNTQFMGPDNDVVFFRFTVPSFGPPAEDTLSYANTASDGRVVDLESETSATVARLLPLGDSITLGFEAGKPQSQWDGYREDLFRLISDAGLLVNYVGDFQSGPGSLEDRDHRGVSGIQAVQVAQISDEIAERTRPDVALVMLGTNDVLRFANSVDTVPQALLQIFQDLEAQSPGVSILVSALPPLEPDVYQPLNNGLRNDSDVLAAAVNAQLEDLVLQAQGLGIDVTLVPMPNLTVADLGDGIHPTDAGYAKIAQEWFDALTSAVSTVGGTFAATPEMISALVKNVVGTELNDSIKGDQQNNAIDGRGGNDSLAGREGNDTLTGGAGRDAFVFFDPADGVDTITDFVSGVDRIEISALGFTALTAGQTNALGTVLFYNSSTGALTYDPDGAGGAVGVQIATLVGAPGLVASDIVITNADGAAPDFTNQAPSVAAESQIFAISETVAQGRLTAEDRENDSLTFAVDRPPSKGVLALAADGSYTYTPNNGYSGADDFTFTVSDGTTASSGSARVRVDTDGTQVNYSLHLSVNEGIRGSQASPKVAALADGGSIVVWAASNPTNPDSDSFGIYARRYGADGEALGGPVLVNGTTAGEQALPAVTGLADGGYVVVWHTPNVDGSEDGIVMQRYAADGSTLGSETLVNETTFWFQEYANVSQLSGGGYVVTWIGWGASGSYDIFARIFADNGTAVTGEFVVNATTSGNQYSNSWIAETITALPDGRFVIVWQDESGKDGSGYGVFARVFEANGTPVTSDIQVNTTFLNHQYDASVSAVAGGGFVVVWTDVGGADGSGNGIFAQRFDANGLAIDGEFRVNAETVGNQQFSKIEMLSDGGFAVFWETSDGATSKLAGQRYASDGSAVGGEFAFDVRQTLSDHYPSLALRNDGALIVVWRGNGSSTVEQQVIENFDRDTAARATTTTTVADGTNTAFRYIENASLNDGGHIVVWEGTGIESPDGDNGGIYGQRIDDAGDPVGSAFLVNTTTMDSQRLPSVAGLADGGYVVTWDSWTPDTTAYDVKLQRYAADGSRLGSETQVNQTTTGSQSHPTVADLSGGGFVVTWWDSRIEFADVYARLYADDGTAVTDEFIVNVEAAGYQATGSNFVRTATGLTGGGFVIVWEDHSGHDGSGRGVFARVFAENGTALSGDILVNSTTIGNQRAASVGALADGGFVVAWTDDDGLDGSGRGIFAQRFSSSGAKLGGELQVDSHTLDSQEHPQVEKLADGGFIIVWETNSGWTREIAGQRFGADGQPNGSEFWLEAPGGGSNQYPSITLRNDGALIVNWYAAGVGIKQQIITNFDDRLGERVLEGGDGPDSLTGWNYDDTLSGEGGDDRITGLRGDDTLTGGDGEDTFVFLDPTDGVDTITDFVPGVDRIEVSALGFTALTPGQTDALGTVLFYDTNTGALTYDPDGVGGDAGVEVAILSGAPALAGSDIVVTDAGGGASGASASLMAGTSIAASSVTELGEISVAHNQTHNMVGQPELIELSALVFDPSEGVSNHMIGPLERIDENADDAAAGNWPHEDDEDADLPIIQGDMVEGWQ